MRFWVITLSIEAVLLSVPVLGYLANRVDKLARGLFGALIYIGAMAFAVFDLAALVVRWIL